MLVEGVEFPLVYPAGAAWGRPERIEVLQDEDRVLGRVADAAQQASTDRELARESQAHPLVGRHDACLQFHLGQVLAREAADGQDGVPCGVGNDGAGNGAG